MQESFRLDLTRRPRRMRRSGALRALANETSVLPQHLIQPVFVIDGEGTAEVIDSMPGIHRLTIPLLIEECRELLALGISAVAL
ncbi:MAG: porphobilinogen synthase, partial [Opitutales bacterium]|nr:porphobilinogen synthase [Opitutales bacterium]